MPVRPPLRFRVGRMATPTARPPAWSSRPALRHAPRARRRRWPPRAPVAVRAHARALVLALTAARTLRRRPALAPALALPLPVALAVKRAAGRRSKPAPRKRTAPAP